MIDTSGKREIGKGGFGRVVEYDDENVVKIVTNKDAIGLFMKEA